METSHYRLTIDDFRLRSTAQWTKTSFKNERGFGRQIVRSSSSVGANYRAACRAKSTADMINKLKTVEEEADKTLFWLELLVESSLMPKSRLQDLMQETDEILAMTVASINTLRKRKS